MLVVLASSAASGVLQTFVFWPVVRPVVVKGLMIWSDLKIDWHRRSLVLFNSLANPKFN